MANHLANATSPYLLQHKDNPVDWYPWCDEALERARAEQKPIFLSIGYSACHWCHVMEHESFEDPDVAELLNNHFIPIKVDREEHPDLDHIYMAAVQMMTGRGGWPLSVFLTPELKPFYGGTYWPRSSRYGMPGFLDVLRAVADAWDNRQDQAAQVAEELTEQLAQIEHPARDERPLPDERQWHAFFAEFASQYDRQHGGFGGAPKFPQPMLLEALLRDYCRHGSAESLEMATTTLRRMHAGGIYDHLGGGFARYSVDTQWLVPHFEKMLYDNALLAEVYLRAWQVTRDDTFATVTRETLDYLLRDMRVSEQAFAASEDADSEGEEGKFYVWTWEELQEALGERVDDAADAFGLREQGNWEGKNILHLPRSIPELAERWGVDASEAQRIVDEILRTLRKVRAGRTRPARDDKVIASWNAMAIRALAEAGRALAETRYVEAAQKAMEFLQTELVDEEGRLHHCWSQGQRGPAAFADDYALAIDALISLHQATGNTEWLEQACTWAGQLRDLFQDTQHGGFFLTGADQPVVWVRPKPTTDSSVPSANNAAATALARLGLLTHDPAWTDLAAAAVRPALKYLDRAPLAAAQALVALDWIIGPSWTAVWSGGRESETWQTWQKAHQADWLPRVLFRWESEPGALPDGAPALESPSLLACQIGSCQPPIVGRESIESWLAANTCDLCAQGSNRS